MAENTRIQWSHHTQNFWLGCTKVHAGCTNCYAEEQMDRRYHRVKWGPASAGGTRSVTSTWGDPLRWQREAERLGIRYRVFMSSLCDIFENWLGPMVNAQGVRLYEASEDQWVPEDEAITRRCLRRPVTMKMARERAFRIVDQTPNLDYLVLTKRPENILAMWPGGTQLYRHNVWRGTSPCDQQTANSSIPPLVATNHLSPVAFLSCEPLLGGVDVRQALQLAGFHQPPGELVHWIIPGGESKQGGEVRPCHIEDIRFLIRQGREYNIPVFVKQVGDAPEDLEVRQNVLTTETVRVPLPLQISVKKGGEMTDWPDDIRIREFPVVGAPPASAPRRMRV